MRAGVAAAPRTARWARWTRGHGRTHAMTAYLFLAPAFIGLMVFTLIPFFLSFYYSLTDYNVLSPPVWRGLANYQKLFQSKVFWVSLWNTFYYTIGTIPAKLIIGLALALLLNRALRGIAVFRAMYYLPVVTATIAVSVIWLWIYNPSYGLANMALEAVGLPRQSMATQPNAGYAQPHDPRRVEIRRHNDDHLPGRPAGHPRDATTRRPVSMALIAGSNSGISRGHCSDQRRSSTSSPWRSPVSKSLSRCTS